jgi:energy-coupling factor transporter ATP-binding protein EcfA2
MPHLEHVSVEGFKKIEELELSAGQFNVVTGRNNSGKTSLLQAIKISSTPEFIEKVETGYQSIPYRTLRSSHLEVSVENGTYETDLITPIEKEARNSLSSLISSNWANIICSQSSFEREDLFSDISRSVSTGIERATSEYPIQEIVEKRYVIIETDDGVFGYLRPNPEVREAFEFVSEVAIGRINEKTDLEIVRTQISQTILGDLETDVNRISDTMLSDQAYGFLPESPRGQVPSKFVEKFHDVVSSRNHAVKEDDIGDFLRDKQILDDLKSFSLDHLVFDPEDEQKYSVPFDQMGEGFKAIVGILWELLDDDLPEVVFLEEPDTHMHPGYVRELVYFLIDLAREEDIQLFVTTHNNDFLNDLFVENLTDEEVEFLESEFRLIQMQDGAADVMDYREAEHTLEELMLDLRGL